MVEQNNGQRQDKRRIPLGAQSRYTGELLLRTRPRTYRAITRELAEPNASVNGIARRYRVSNHTVMGIREREAKSIAERKKTLAAALCNVAGLGVDRMAQKVGNPSLRDATIATGVAVDKVLALTNHTPIVAVQVNIPTPEEQAKRQALDDKLGAIAQRLASLP